MILRTIFLSITLFFLISSPSYAKKYYVTAYCQNDNLTATGIKPYVGMCAGPKKYLRKVAIIRGKKYPILDVHPKGQFDIWMKTRKECMKWGRKKLEVTIVNANNTSMYTSKYNKPRAK